MRIYSIKDLDKRRATVQAFVGQRVRIVAGRGYEWAREGTLLAVAIPADGMIADLAILETKPGHHPVAISLASIISIEAIA